MLVSLTEEKTYKMLVEKMDAGESFIGEDILLEFTNYELLHGILTCSLPISLLFPAFLRKRNTELCYKLALSEAALDTDGEDLRKSSRISYLDSAEKSMISYYLGNFFTFLITRKLFYTEYLLHLNYMRDGKVNAYDSAGKKKRQETHCFSVFCRFIMRITGLEPARRRHQILSLARLPIPPYPHDQHHGTIRRTFHRIKKEPSPGSFLSERAGIRTPDNLIKSQEFEYPLTLANTDYFRTV